MDTEKIRIFMTAAETGSFRETAERLGYTISGISRSVASLEAETQLTLFTRSKHGVAPTRDAEALMPCFRDMLAAEQRYTDRLQELHGLECGTVTVGISYAAYYRVISQTMRDFLSRWPNIEIRTMQATSSELLHAMERHEIDFAVMTYREGGYHFHELQEDPMVVCVSRNHPLAKEDSIPLSVFEQESVVAAYPDRETDYRRVFDRFGIRPNIRYTAMDVYAAYCMVEAGLGISLSNLLEVNGWNGDVVMRPSDPSVTLKIGILYPDENEMTIAARRLLRFILERQENGKSTHNP